MKVIKKPRVGIFSITSCAGCQFTILFLRDVLMDLFDSLDIINFPMLKSKNEEGPFDVSFIEGTVVREEEIEYITEIREKSNVVVALGTCATYGGVPCIKDFGYEADLPEEFCPQLPYLHSVKASGIRQYIRVDYYLRGCPPVKEEIVQLVKDLLVGKKRPEEPNFPVCMECRRLENPCLLQQDIFCMGPVTHGGCDALCPSNGISCYGCRGPLEDANIEAIVDLFEEQGMTIEELKKYFAMFAGTSKKFKEVGILNE